MGQRELEVLDENLLHVRSADVFGLLNLNNLEDLQDVNLQLNGTRDFVDVPEPA